MSHEVSETVERGGRYFNVYGAEASTVKEGRAKAGDPLPVLHEFEQESYDTQDAAVAAAKRRSEMVGQPDTRPIPVMRSESKEEAAMGQQRLEAQPKGFLDRIMEGLGFGAPDPTKAHIMSQENAKYILSDDYKAHVNMLKESDSYAARAQAQNPLASRYQGNTELFSNLMRVIEGDTLIQEKALASVARFFGKDVPSRTVQFGGVSMQSDEFLPLGEAMKTFFPGLSDRLVSSLKDRGWSDEGITTLLALPGVALGVVFDPLNLVAPPGMGQAAHAAKAGAKAAKAAKTGKEAAKITAEQADELRAGLDELASTRSEEVIKNFNETGGAGITYNLKRGDLGKVDTDEWAVSMFPEREVVINGREPNSDDIQKFMAANEDLLKDPRVSIGMWKDDNGAIHLEPSYTTRSRPQAEALGKQFDQQGIFNLKTKEFVATGGSGKPDLGKLPPLADRLTSDTKVGLVDEFPSATPLAYQFDIEAAPAVDALRRANEGEKAGAAASQHLKVAGAAAIHRGAKSLVQFKQSLMPDLPPSILKDMTEKRWQSLFEQSKERYKQVIDTFGVAEVPTIQQIQKLFKKGEYNKAWYNDFRPTVESMFGTDSYTLPSGVVTNDAEMFTKFFAATSPRTPVERADGLYGKSNVEHAVQAFIEWKTGKPFSNDFPGHLNNLNRAAEGLPFSDTSPKVQSFFRNLWGDPYAVTADGWMAKIFGFDEGNVKAAKYQFIQEVVRQEARRAGVEPREYQAALWVAYRTLQGLNADAELRTVVHSLRDEIGRLLKQDPELFSDLHNWQQILDAANIRKPGFLDGQAFGIPLKNAAKFSKLSPEQKAMAQRYHNAPEFDEEAVPLWNALAKEVEERYAELSQKYKFIPVDDDAPYNTAQEMFDDLAKGQLKVSTQHNEHPIFTPEQNFKFRAVHDVLGHYEGQGDFTLAGEARTFETQKWAHSEEARQALEVEVMGQATAALDKGGFQVQKVFVPGKDYGAVPDLAEAGVATLPAVLFLARAFAGATAGAMIGDEEDKLRNALIGAGLGAFATPKLLTKLTKLAQAQKAVPDKPAFFGTAEGRRLAQTAKLEKAMPLNQIALDYKRTLEEMKGDVRHWKDVLGESELLANYGLIDQDYLRAMQPGRTLNDAELGAASIVMSRSYSQLRNLADQVVRNPQNAEAEAEFIKQLVAHGMSDIGRLSATTEAGRSLAIHNAIAPQTEYLNRVSDLMSRLRAGQSTQRIAELLLREPDPMAAAVAARIASKPGFSDMVMEAWVLGLVSGFKTLAINLGGGALFTGMNVVERGAARLYGQAVAPGEATKMLQGMFSSFNESLKGAWIIMRDFENLAQTHPELLAKYDIKDKVITAENAQDLYLMRKLGIHLFNDKNEPNVLGRAVDYIGSVIRLPARGLLGTDTFFRGINMQAELQAQALREAHAEAATKGLTGNEFNAAVKRNYMKLLANPPDDLVRAAKDFAEYSVFQRGLGPFGQAVQQVASSTPAAKIMLPFVKTPGNVLKAGIFERTPVALLTKEFRDAIKRGGADAELAMSRLAVGSMAMSFFAMLGGAGIVTGSLPSNPAARKIDQDNGLIAGAINLSKLKRIVSGTDDGTSEPQKGDKFVEVDRLDPLGLQLLMAADYARIVAELPEADAEELALALSAVAAKSAASRSWIKGLTEIAMGVSDPDKYAERVLEKFAGTLIPFSGLRGGITREIDPTIREAQSILDEAKKNAWPFSTQVKPARDLFANIVKYPPGVGPDIASPLPMSTYKDHPVLSALKFDDVALALPGKTFPTGDGRTIPLTPQEQDRYEVLAGKEVKDAFGRNYEQAMLNVIKMADDLKRTKGPDSWRAAEFRSVTEYFRAKAREQMLKEFPDLKQAVGEAQLELRRAQGKPVFNANQLQVQ